MHLLVEILKGWSGGGGGGIIVIADRLRPWTVNQKTNRPSSQVLISPPA
jgi:hypothetical protein